MPPPSLPWPPPSRPTPAHSQDVHDDTQGPHVTGLVILLWAQHFWSCKPKVNMDRSGPQNTVIYASSLEMTPFPTLWTIMMGL